MNNANYLQSIPDKVKFIRKQDNNAIMHYLFYKF